MSIGGSDLRVKSVRPPTAAELAAMSAVERRAYDFHKEAAAQNPQRAPRASVMRDGSSRDRGASINIAKLGAKLQNVL
jgi:hypothetical protein